MTITVYGTPGPQGSKRFVGLAKSGRGIMIESSAKVKPWREAIAWAVREQMAGQVGNMAGWVGPVSMEVTFTFARPKKYASPKKAHIPMSTRPDLSKLVRSTEDALTSAGAWEDDARVVSTLSRKVYPGQHPDALHVPGAVIRIAAVGA